MNSAKSSVWMLGHQKFAVATSIGATLALFGSAHEVLAQNPFSSPSKSAISGNANSGVPARLVNPGVRSASTRRGAIRTVRILAFVDQMFSEKFGAEGETVPGEGRARETIEKASTVYEQEFGIALAVVGIQRFNGIPYVVDESGADTLIDQLKNKVSARELDRRGADIAILFGWQSGMKQEGNLSLGHAEPLGRWIGMSDRYSWSVVHTLVHELGHSFGGVHVSDPNSFLCSIDLEIESEPCKDSSLTFDSDNRQIIELSRDRLDFKKGVKSFDSKDIAEYGSVANCTGKGTNFICQAYLDEAESARARNDTEAEMENLQQAVKANPSDGWAQNYMGQAHLKKGNTNEALASYLRAVEVDPENCFNYLDLGKAYEKVGQLEQAKKAYMKAQDVGSQENTRCKEFAAEDFARLNETTQN